MALFLLDIPRPVAVSRQQSPCNTVQKTGFSRRLATQWATDKMQYVNVQFVKLGLWESGFDQLDLLLELEHQIPGQTRTGCEWGSART